jgi:hypothetical protein
MKTYTIISASNNSILDIGGRSKTEHRAIV